MAFWHKWKKKDMEESQREDENPSKEMEQGLDTQYYQQRKAEKEKQKEIESVLKDQNLEQESIIPVGRGEVKNFIRDCCESIAESENQVDQIKQEYEHVTEYLTDIQKIDRIAGESREVMLELCKKIKHLLQIRNQYKNREIIISDAQVRRFDLYKEDLIDEIKKMYQSEMYQQAIETDMKHLESEKKYLRQNQQEIIEKQNALKGMAKILAALIVSLIVLFVVIYYTMKIDMSYPYMGTLLLAAISATVIFVESNRNRRDMTVAERKMNKAISLLNRIKIKYINNVSALDYNRQKFQVKDAANFEMMWGEYCKAKEYERKFKENTEQLNKNNEELLALLTEYQLAEPEVWLVQCYAILDNREMVEIRHELNQRRQKLREQIEYNTNLKKSLLDKMDILVAKSPEFQQQIEKIIEEFKKQKQKN